MAKRGNRPRRSGPPRGRAAQVRAMVEEWMEGEVDGVSEHLDRYIGRKYFGGLYVLFRALFATLRRHTRRILVNQLRDAIDTLDEPAGPGLLKRLMRHDIVTLYLRKSHPNYPRIAKLGEELALENREFLLNLVRAGIRAGEKRWPLTFEEIHRAAYPLRGDAKAALMARFWKAHRIIELIRKDPKIVDLPLGRGLILDVLEEGVRYSRQQIDRSLDAVYG